MKKKTCKTEIIQPRRIFLKKILAATAGLSLSPSLIAGSGIPSRLGKIGIILNTVKDDMNKDYKATLVKLKEIGYKYVEGGVYGNSTAEYLHFLKKTGLKPLCTGSGMHPLKEDPDKFIRLAKEMGVKYLVCYYPWLVGSGNISYDLCMEAAENLNKIGKRCKDAGLQFAWHNHNWEFTNLSNGKKPFDIIMENTDSDYVSVQMDLYWVVKAGCDPVDYFRKYPGRTPLVHVKDMDNTPEKAIACVGDGIIDFKRILSHAKVGGVKHCIIEHEKNTAGISCAEVGYNHLKSFI